MSLLIYFTDVGRIGIGICYDICFQELAMLYAARGMTSSCVYFSVVVSIKL
jgi:predicted amidohydrolase